MATVSMSEVVGVVVFAAWILLLNLSFRPRKLVAEARTEGGRVPDVAQSGSLDLSVLGSVEENDAWIWEMVVGEDRSHSMQVIHNDGVDPACFDEIDARNRPVRFFRHSVSRRQFVKWPAFLLGSDVPLNRKRRPDFGR